MAEGRPRRLTPRHLLVDITPLKQSVPFRWLFGGLSLSWMARQLTVVAVPFQVYELTGSPFLVGLLGLAQLIPLLATSVVGGALVDSVDRRRLLVITQVASMATAAGLAYNATLDQPSVWLIFALSALNAGFSAIDSPARAASLPGMVGRQLLPAALAISQTVMNTAKTLGPALGGLLIAQAGFAATYSVETVAFFLSALLMFRVGDLKPEGGGQRFGWESIKEGYRFLIGRRLLQANFIIDINAMVFGMPQALFPIIGTEVLGGDATTVGLLYAAPGLGALLAAMTSGWVGSVKRQGRAVILAVVVWGAAIAVFGLVTSVWVALVLLALAGGADVISAVFRSTILQLAVPDRLRGRLSSIQIAVTAGGPRLGDFEAGAVAAATSTQFSVVSGGVLCVLGALFIARKVPEYESYEALAEEEKKE